MERGHRTDDVCARQESVEIFVQGPNTSVMVPETDWLGQCFTVVVHCFGSGEAHEVQTSLQEPEWGEAQRLPAHENDVGEVEEQDTVPNVSGAVGRHVLLHSF